MIEGILAIAAMGFISAGALTAAGRAQVRLVKMQTEQLFGMEAPQADRLKEEIWDPLLAEPIPQDMVDLLRNVK